MGSIIMRDSMKGLWNAILKVEGRMRGMRLSRFFRRIWLKRWRILFIGEIWHIVVGVKVSVGCINYEKWVLSGELEGKELWF